jgi:hypothetical protein
LLFALQVHNRDTTPPHMGWGRVVPMLYSCSAKNIFLKFFIDT